MSKSTYANKLPRALAADLALVGEQICNNPFPCCNI